MINIKTSVQAKESILKNAAALEPVQDGDRYTYTIHTPTEAKLEKAVTFQVFVTIPRQLESLESFLIQGNHLELSIGNIGHTFIRSLAIQSARGDTTIENFYGESAIVKSTIAGGIVGKYSVARLLTTAKSGKIHANVHLLNTDEDQPPAKVICSTMNYPVNLSVDGTDLFGQFTVEAKTQCQPLDAKILLANPEQRLLGNFINFGGPTRIKLSGNYQGRIETRTHYGRIIIDEPEFEQIEGAMLSLPSMSDRNGLSSIHLSSHSNHSSSSDSASTSGSSSASSIHHQHQQSTSTPVSSRTSSHGSTAWDRDDPRHHQGYLNHPHDGETTTTTAVAQSVPGSTMALGTTSRANSIHGSTHETRSVSTARSEQEKKKKKKEEEKDSVITREVIGTIGKGPGLIMAKNSSGDITLSLI